MALSADGPTGPTNLARTPTSVHPTDRTAMPADATTPLTVRAPGVLDAVGAEAPSSTVDSLQHVRGAAVMRIPTGPRPLDLVDTLDPLGHGPYDPTFHVERSTLDAVVWLACRFRTGTATLRLAREPGHVIAQAWGDGAGDALASVPNLVGADDDPTGFEPPAVLRESYRRHPGLRVPRSGRVLDVLIPTVLEQRIQTEAAWRSWSWLLRRYGSVAPGPTPVPMIAPPTAREWARIPTWDFHRAGVDPARARTVVAVARVAPRMEECARMDSDAAQARLRAVPGVGAWTAAKVAQRALGDADAVHTGDVHLPAAVGWALTRRRADDERMLELLAPFAPHRYRVLRLLELADLARAPRRGPRLSIQDHRRN